MGSIRTEMPFENGNCFYIHITICFKKDILILPRA